MPSSSWTTTVYLEWISVSTPWENPTMFTTFDWNSGYWQIPVSNRDRYKKAIVCHYGLYLYKRIPFGLTNAPATFQRAPDILLSQYKWRSCLVYMDDVTIFSRCLDSHVSHFEQVLSSLSCAGGTLKLKKCEFFTKEVRYLGRVIQSGSFSIEKSRTVALTHEKQ